MMRRLGIALSALFLLALAGGILAWAVETPAERLNRRLDEEVRLKPPPDFSIDSTYENSSAYSCEPGVDCVIVYTKGFDAMTTKELASTTWSIYHNQYYGSKAVHIEFMDASQTDTGASYCFASKDHLIRKVGEKSLEHAQLLGRISHYSDWRQCYIVVWKL